MVKWDELDKPKDHRGLGFTETRLINMCVLSNWREGIKRCVVTW
jgi:hypothetical protein